MNFKKREEEAMSSAKHFTEVLIGGKVYTLSGFEGEEYLQKVSSYLNHKITECTNSEGYRKQSADKEMYFSLLTLPMITSKQKNRVIRWRVTLN